MTRLQLHDDSIWAARWIGAASALVFVLAHGLGLGRMAPAQLGLPWWTPLPLVALELVLAGIDVHVWTLRSAHRSLRQYPPTLQRMILQRRPLFFSHTDVRASVGAAVIPVLFSLFAAWRDPPSALLMWATTLLLVLVGRLKLRAHAFRTRLLFRAAVPLTAAVVPALFDPAHRVSAALCASCAALLAAEDVLVIGDFRHLGAPRAVIGTPVALQALVATQLLAFLSQ